MKTLARFPSDTSIDMIIAGLESAVVIEGLISSELVAQVNSDLNVFVEKADPAMRHINAAVGAFFGQRVRHVSGLAGKSKAFIEGVMCHPLMLAICDHVVLPNCADYRLNLAHLMDRGPGSEQQMLHRDEDNYVHYQRPRPEIQLSTVVHCSRKP